MYKNFVCSFKAHANATLRSWSYQCESILAQRSRRLQQLLSFYQRVYGPQRLRFLLRSYQKQLQNPLNRILLGAVGFCGIKTTDITPFALSNNMNSNKTNNNNSNSNVFNWNNERLSLTNFDACLGDIEFIDTLPHNKLCKLCIEKQMKYCYCLVGNRSILKEKNNEKHFQYSTPTASTPEGSVLIETNNEAKWEPYFSKDEFSIWRREEKPAMFAYKVYARFDDISSSDFLHVQTDIEYRKKWDETAVALEIVETDPTPGSNSHLIYWEMQWPRLFANRDYVYCRRVLTDELQRVMLVCSRGTQHARYPIYSDKVRVSDYWSLMIIKPTNNFEEPGLHYVLTYFDDPGIPIPQSLRSWVTQKQMPDYLRKMYVATKKYSVKKALDLENLTNLNIMHNKYTISSECGSWLGRVLWKQRERSK